MATSYPSLLVDLGDETVVVLDMLASLDAADWRLPTPAEGWSIGDQVSHLAYFDETATLGIVDPDRFRAEAAELVAVGDDFPDQIAARYRDRSGDQLLDWFRQARSAMLDAMGAVDPGLRVPWYGPDMSVASSATARLMETWAHGQDIADVLGVDRKPTHRLRHVAHIGVRTMGFSFGLRGREVPAAPVWVELAAPDGGTWTWGEPDARDRVVGPALDFCLLVTQRRHRDDTELRITGPVADEWMSIAQAFAGAPGPGRPATTGRKQTA